MSHKDIVMHTVCPFCLVEHDLVAELVDEGTPVPYEGAASFCIKCGRFSIFKADLSLRRPTRDEQFDFDNDEHLAQVRWAWRETQRP